jgi:hypothetical protein
VDGSGEHSDEHSVVVVGEGTGGGSGSARGDGGILSRTVETNTGANVFR